MGFAMDFDDSQVPGERSEDDCPRPRLRYDAPHETPPRPLFLRMDAAGPEGDEA